MREPTWADAPSEALVAGLLEGYRRHSGRGAEHVSGPLVAPDLPPIPGRRGRWIGEPRTVVIGDRQFIERQWFWEDAGAA